MAADNSIAISLNEAKFTSVVLTGVRGSGVGTSTAVLSLSNGGETTTYSATMSNGEIAKDFEVTGLSSDTTYTITGTGDFDPNTSITEVTTLVDDPRAAKMSQWQDLVDRVKAKADASSVSGKLDNTTTFWGQTASGGTVTGDLDLGAVSMSHPKSVSANSGNTKLTFKYASPDNGEYETMLYAHNPLTNSTAFIDVVAASGTGIVVNAPITMKDWGAQAPRNKITELADGTSQYDAVNKGQLDTAISGIGGVKKAGSSAWEPTVLQYINENSSGAKGALFDAGLDLSDEPFYVGIGASGDDTPADGYGPRPYMLSGSVDSNGKKLTTLKKRIPLFSELEDRILAGGTTAPTTSTVGKVGTLYAYVESGTGHLAICTAVSGSTYTWQVLI